VSIELDGGGALLLPEHGGQYELSGALYAYDQVPGLISGMQAIGFKQWRVGLGRWEIGTEALDTVPGPDGGTVSCPAPPFAFMRSTHPSLDAVIAYRDFFKLNVDHLPAGLDVNDMDDAANYDFAYVDSVVSVAEAFGAEPYLDVDYTPRVLSSVQTPAVADCGNTFANGVTTAPPVSNDLYARAVIHVLAHLLDGWPNNAPKHVIHYVEIGNEPENVPYFWSGTEQQFDVWFASVAAGIGAFRASVSATDPAWAALKIGGGSFAEAPGNRNWLPHALDALDAANVSVDFISMHSYHDVPQAVVVDEVATVQELLAARHNGRYLRTERVLAEWGPGLNHLGDAAFNKSMSAPLVYGAGLAGAEAVAFSFTQKALFWDFAGPGMSYGLLDSSAMPEPAYRAYQLFDQLVTETPLRAPFPAVLPSPGFEGIAVAGVSADATKVDLYVVNVLTEDRELALTFTGGVFTPATVTTQILDGTGSAIRTSSGLLIPARSVCLVQLR
jgi:hypothetical protein